MKDHEGLFRGQLEIIIAKALISECAHVPGKLLGSIGNVSGEPQRTWIRGFDGDNHIDAPYGTCVHPL